MPFHLLRSRKAQIQSGETIAVAIIISIMIVLGLLYAYSFRIDSIERGTGEERDLSATSVALSATRLDDIRCSMRGEQVYICLDMYRLEALSNIIEADEYDAFTYYYGIFGNSRITVSYIHPEAYSGQNITLYDFNSSRNDTGRTSHMPLIVSDLVNATNVFAVMEVKVFS